MSEFPQPPSRPTHHVTRQPTARMSRLSRRSFTNIQETRIRHESDKIYESDEEQNDEADGPAEDLTPEDVFEQAVTTEINNGNVKLYEPLTIECDYGGLTIEGKFRLFSCHEISSVGKIPNEMVSAGHYMN